MSNQLSFSSISLFNTCGQKYFYRYEKKYAGKYHHAALAFGSAIDTGLNILLLTKDLKKAKEAFDKAWSFQWVNKKYVALSENVDIVYADTDFDEDLVRDDLNVSLELYKELSERKSVVGWDKLSEADKKVFNHYNWLSMKQKGYIMLESYEKKVLPRIKEVLCVQKENFLINSDFDKVKQVLDLIVVWEDGRRILADNKTSAKDYLEDSAGRSPQLVSYFHGAKEEYKLDAVAFFVLKKGLLKNKVKTCSKCSFDGSGTRHQTCNNVISSKRCNGTWNVQIFPECYIQIIINDVAPASEDLVLSAFDEANEGIKKKNWYKNLSACRQGNIICEYEKLCWKQDASDIIDLNQVKKDAVQKG